MRAPSTRAARFRARSSPAAAKLGLMGVTIPAEQGGAGRDYVSYALAIEALATASAVVAVIAAVNNSLVAEPLAQFGSDAQRERWLRRAGVGRGARRVCAVGGTRRIGCRQSADRRPPRRERLRDPRPQGLGRQRRSRRRDRRLCGHAARPARPRRQRVSGAAGHARPDHDLERRVARRPRPRLHGSRASTTCGSGPRRCSARRARDSGSRCGRSTAGASRLPRRRSGSGRRRSTRRSPTPRLTSSSASRSATTRRSSGCSPTWRPTSTRRGC